MGPSTTFVSFLDKNDVIIIQASLEGKNRVVKLFLIRDIRPYKTWKIFASY